jgi:inosine triphosphate pyrophosphatase
MKQKIYFITANNNKILEAKSILDDNKYEIIQYDIDLSEYQGDSHTIAFKKCLEAKKILSKQQKHYYPLIIDDTSLEFNALNGMPGPYVKWFLDAIKAEGLAKMLDGYDDKSAKAICNISFLLNDHCDPIIFTGNVNGKIVHPNGPNTFGWDPIFIPDTYDGGNGLTYAEMDKKHKNNISHRYKALVQLKDYLNHIYL